MGSGDYNEATHVTFATLDKETRATASCLHVSEAIRNVQVTSFFFHPQGNGRIAVDLCLCDLGIPKPSTSRMEGTFLPTCFVHRSQTPITNSHSQILQHRYLNIPKPQNGFPLN